MYLRHNTRRKDGKVHTSWRLVLSARIGCKVVQQTVAPWANWTPKAEPARGRRPRRSSGVSRNRTCSHTRPPRTRSSPFVWIVCVWKAAGASGTCGWVARVTVEEIIGTMEARYGLAQRTWVMDRGMTSEENLACLQTSGRRYLLGTPKSELRKWARALTDERDWTTVR